MTKPTIRINRIIEQLINLNYSTPKCKLHIAKLQNANG